MLNYGEVESAGVSLRYAVAGDGPAVVLTHGAGTDHRMFAAQVSALAAAGYQAIVWDLRGHGLSRPCSMPITAQAAVGDLAALLSHLRLQEVVLVGQSLGGNVAQSFTKSEPNMVRGLVVVGAAWNAGPLSALDRVLLDVTTPILRAVPHRWLAGLMANASATNPAARRVLREVFNALTKDEFVAAWAAAVQSLDPDPTYRTPVPLGLIRGAHDRTGNIASSMPRWARHEGVEEHVIADAGHVANMDAPEAVNAVLLDFLAGL